MSHEQQIAYIRAFIGGALQGVLVFLTTWQAASAATGATSGEAAAGAGMAGGIAFLLYVIQRGGFEGALDTRRNAGQPLENDPEHL